MGNKFEVTIASQNDIYPHDNLCPREAVIIVKKNKITLIVQIYTNL